jgi:hypothetical protein
LSLVSQRSTWLTDALIGGGITSHQVEVFNAAWDAGGYIAGGFARMVGVLDARSRNELTLYPTWRDREGWRNLTLYVEMMMEPPRPPWEGKAVSNWNWKWRGTVGDVDLFFPNEASAWAAISRVKSRFGEGIHLAPTAAGYAQEVVHDRCRYQFITKVNGTPEEVLDSFDLTNAKVALTPDAILTTPEWRELEEKRAIGIDVWSKPNLLWRVWKWARKHTYLKLRSSDEDRFVNVVFDALEATKDGSLKRWDRPVTKHEIQRFAKMFVHTLEPSSALKAAMILDDYDRMNVMRDVMSKGVK